MSDSRWPKNPFDGFRIEIDPDKVEDAKTRFRAQLEEARERVEEAWDSGRYTKIRVRYRGKQVGPDIPMTAFLAGQGVALVALQPLWVLLGNLGAKAVLDVELVHESDELVAAGNDAYLHGDVETAEKAYRDALERRDGDPAAHYHLGVLLRVTGRLQEAGRHLKAAAEGPEGHPSAVKARETLERLEGKRTL